MPMNKSLVSGICVLVLAVGLVVAGCDAVGFDTADSGVGRLDPPDPDVPLPPSESYLGVYWDAAVTSNGPLCSIIGRDILMKKGNAVEAAIATLFCEGVVSLQSMGLGGGFFMTVYEKDSGKVSVLNAREMAPAAVTEDMFDGDADAAQTGGKAVAIPGELKGYWEAFNRFKSGNVTWAELIQPTIDICNEGLLVSRSLASIFLEKEDAILNSPSLSEILVDPSTGYVWLEGDVLKRPRLAQTLEIIATEGGEAFYTGSLVDGFVSDMQELGGIITKEDMANYRVEWGEPIIAELAGGMKMYTVPPPSSGMLVAFMLNILDGFLPGADDVITHHRITESIKYAYGRRTEMGDPNYVDISELIANLTSKDYASFIRSEISDDVTYQDPEHYGAILSQPENHGTAHISVLAPNGDAVAVTSTINLYFGAKVASRSTGIILNDIMDDFSSPNITNDFGIPPSPANFIRPGKRPLSAMCPSIFVDAVGDVQLVVGAAGGTKITTAVTLVALHNLWLNQTIKEAVDAPRFHHQLFPMRLQYEYGTLSGVVQGLEGIGHNTTRFRGGSTVTAIARKDGMIHANSDFRRSGSTTAGF